MVDVGPFGADPVREITVMPDNTPPDEIAWLERQGLTVMTESQVAAGPADFDG